MFFFKSEKTRYVDFKGVTYNPYAAGGYLSGHNDEKETEKWLKSWQYLARALQWIPTWQGLDGFQKSLRRCNFDENGLSIERSKTMTHIWFE